MTADIKPQTEMTNAPVAQVKMIKCKTVHPIRVKRDGEDTIIAQDQEVSLTEAEAKEFCDKKFSIGHKGMRAGQLGNQPETTVTRAVRL